jgi:hypothetical protein
MAQEDERPRDAMPGATSAATSRGRDPEPGGVFELHDGPRHVTHDDAQELPGHYEATFATDDAGLVRRYLTDKGRAELLRLVDAGQRSFRADELAWLTTEPTVEALLASMSGEGSEGA